MIIQNLQGKERIMYYLGSSMFGTRSRHDGSVLGEALKYFWESKLFKQFYQDLRLRVYIVLIKIQKRSAENLK